MFCYMLRYIFAAFFLVAFSTTSFADTVPQLFEKLRDSGVDYMNSGAVCEQVARLELERHYPQSIYAVVTGIAYADLSRTVGELDVVVFDRRGGNAVLVGEVKCWNDLRKARKKAADQRARFMDTMRSGAQIDLFLASNRSVYFRREQFQSLSQFISISQRGGRAHGFEVELPNTIAEMRALRAALMRCQAEGQCRRP